MSEKCTVRIVASFLPYDIECVRDKHTNGAHMNKDGKPFLVTDKPKPPPLPTRSRKVVIRRKKKRTVRVKRPK